MHRLTEHTSRLCASVFAKPIAEDCLGMHSIRSANLIHPLDVVGVLLLHQLLMLQYRLFQLCQADTPKFSVPNHWLLDSVPLAHA